MVIVYKYPWINRNLKLFSTQNLKIGYL